MWRKYHSISTTPEYKALCKQFLKKNYQLSCITHILPLHHRCDFTAVDSGTVPPPKRKCRATPPRVISLQSTVPLRNLQIESCVLTVELDDSAPDPLLCLCDPSTCYSPEVCNFLCCVFTALRKDDHCTSPFTGWFAFESRHQGTDQFFSKL